jgi:hypothetical protein
MWTFFNVRISREPLVFSNVFTVGTFIVFGTDHKP